MGLEGTSGYLRTEYSWVLDSVNLTVLKITSQEKAQETKQNTAKKTPTKLKKHQKTVRCKVLSGYGS